MTEAAVVRLVLSLFFIVLLILAGAWVTRRAGWLRPASNQNIKLVGTRSLGARAYVAIVEIEDARLVLGVTTTRISLLHTLPGATQGMPAGEASSAQPTSAFASSLRKLMVQHR